MHQRLRRRLRAALAAIAAAAGLVLAASPAPASAPAPDAAVTVSGAGGTTTTLTAPAQRIVSLAPHLTELLFAAGAGDRVIGTSAWSDHPPAAVAIPRIGDSHAFDIERILGLQPDLVVAWDGNAPRHVAQLRRLGIPIHLEGAERLDDIGAALERLGRLADTEAQAQEAADRYRQRLAGLRERHAGLAPVPVFHQIWDQPLMTINGRHPVSDLIAACGGENVFAGSPALTPTVSYEAVLRAGPQVITAADDTEDPLAAWRRWPTLPAVAGGRLIALPADAISRLSPRLLDAAAPLCGAIAAARGADTVSSGIRPAGSAHAPETP
ncbi:MAG: cobalamin-binding protein [Burkholderiaceae bacterium]